MRGPLRQGCACRYAAQAAEGWQAQQGGRQGAQFSSLSYRISQLTYEEANGEQALQLGGQGVKAKGKAPPPEPVKEGPSVDELNQRIAALEAEKKREEELRNYMQLERARLPSTPFTCSLCERGPAAPLCRGTSCLLHACSLQRRAQLSRHPCEAPA